MVTFLNEKEDKHLRGAFFDSIVGVASYVGWHGTTALLPLLQQVRNLEYNLTWVKTEENFWKNAAPLK